MAGGIRTWTLSLEDPKLNQDCNIPQCPGQAHMDIQPYKPFSTTLGTCPVYWALTVWKI